jgi:putative intracellular protease/amidase
MQTTQITRRALKRGLVGFGWSLLTLLLLCAAVVAWVASVLDWSEPADFTRTQAADLPYLAAANAPVRGKILAIVTSTATMQVPKDDGVKTKPAGFELTELARAYAVFTANGFVVDIASPKGGAAPFVQDDDDMGAFDYAFLNDPAAMAKVNASIALSAVDISAYQAVYLVGGKGTMFDFRQNPRLQQLLSQSWQQGAVLAAVCHGPAGLLGVKDADGKALLAGRTVTAFSNAEELFLIPAAPAVFGTLLEDDLRAAGANVSTGPLYLNHVVVDGRLISGQNPWSVWRLAEATVQALGVTPRERQRNGDEIAVQLLGVYQQQGLSAAQQWLLQLPPDQLQRLDRGLFSIHLLIALMQQQWQQASDVFSLLRQLAALLNTLPGAGLA